MAWTLAQLAVDSLLFMGMGILWLKLRKPPQDDPRLSRGLQLLQSKITVLEDLSDRTDSQVKQLTQILDHKTRYIQDKVLMAEQHVLKIEQSMHKSLEVAEIFQDKIPHEEVLERRRTIQYVKAARMAHAGKRVDEIAASVDLPREQVELITKFNRDQLMFDETALPEWAKAAGIEASRPGFSAPEEMHFAGALESTQPDLSSLNSLGERFKASVRDYEIQTAPPPPKPPIELPPTAKAIIGAAQSITNSLTNTAANFLSIQETPPAMGASTTATASPPASSTTQPQVRKVEFPRIQMPPKI